MPIKYQQTNIGEKLHKASIALKAKTPDELYCSMISRWQNPENLVIGISHQQTVLNHTLNSSEDNIVHKVMEIDSMTYLPDNTLCKVDRASMFASLESKLLFLIIGSSSLPLNYKIKNGVGKPILRDVLYKYVPKELIDRSKTGFGVPISDWLHGPLNEWENDLLNEDRLRSEGFFMWTRSRKYGSSTNRGFAIVNINYGQY